MPRIKKKLFSLLLPSILVVFVGGLITAVATFWLYQSEEQAARAEFDIHAAMQVEKLGSLLASNFDLLTATGSLFQNVGIVDREVFADFAKPLLESHSGISTLAWVPMVRNGEKAEVEAQARARGYSHFQISERAEDGSVRPASERTAYFPVYYAEPFEGVASSIGVDLGADPVRRTAMEMAWSSAKLAAAAPVPSMHAQNSDGQADVFVFMPVYGAGTNMNDLLARSQGLSGFALAVLDAGAFVASVLTETPQLDAGQPTSIYIYDVAQDGSVKPLYLPVKATNGGTAAGYLGLIDQYYDEAVTVHGRQWHVIVKPEYQFVPVGGLVPSVTGIGAAFTLMVAAYILMLRTHTAEMRAAFATQSGELREAQRRETGARSDIEVANKAKSVFLATMSHELRTPLTGVIGYIDLLCSKVTDPEHRQLMDKLRQAANAQRAIVNDVLDYSRISAGTLEIEQEPFKLQDVIDAAVSTYGTIAKEKGVMVGCRVPAEMPHGFIGDPARLQQIVNNLVSNAVKFTHKGSVTVHVSSEIIGGENCALDISVQDTGIGIGSDRINSLFDPFVHTENVTTREFGGTGLGLSICKEIAEKMGGSITVESKQGWGSKFTVSLILPLKEIDENAHKENSYKLLFSGVPLRVLIVEDYALVREMLRATLEKAGHAVVAVDNGAEAYEAIYSPVGERFDLVLMDMHMPIMDGADAVKRIRSLGGCEADIAIIGMSADVMSEHVQRFIDAGINAFVTKPIDWNELGRVMKSVMTSQHSQAAMQRPMFDHAGTVQPLLIADIFTQFINVLSHEQSSGLYDATVAFFADCEKKLNELDNRPDFRKSQELAHTILGAASTVGAMRVSETAHKLCALEVEPNDLPERIEQLKDLLKKSQVEFDKHFSEFKSSGRIVH